MKNKLYCALFFMVILLTACAGTSKIVGSWVDSDGGKYEFYKDGSMTISTLGITMSGSYELIDRETLKMSLEGLLGLGGSTIFNYKVSGDQLTLATGDLTIVLGRTNSTKSSPEKLGDTDSPILVPPTVTQTNISTLTMAPPTSTQTMAPPTSTPTMEPTPTVHGVQNPSGVIPAGMPAIVDGYVLVVDKTDMTVDDDFIGFTIRIRVTGNESRLFRYNAASIKLKDDLGNYYDYYYTISYGTKCTESDIYLAKQITIEPQTEVIIEPATRMMYSSYFWWCLDNQNQVIPGFNAIIPQNARSLILEFEGFGPFSGFGMEFKL